MASFSISKKLKTQKRPVFSPPDKKDEPFFNEKEEEASQEQRKKSGLHANPLNEKANPFNQISLAMPQRFNLSRCQLKKHQICKDLEPSNNATHHIVDQVLGIHFQEEIIMEILIRLPVRSLLRFKCVSKGWKALISDPYFKMKHLNHAKNDHNSQKFLVYRVFFGRNYTDMHCSSLSSDELIEDEQKLDIPMNARCGSCKIHGCCDGLVLIRIVGIERDMHFFLWNPSTRESIELPLPKHLKERLLYGIGYDMIDDDYKILALGVRPLARIEHDQGVSSEVLALKSGSWRDSKYPYPTGIGRVRGFIGCGMNSLAVVHGAFHWVGMSGDYTIVSFNISSEVYGEMPLLEGMCFKETERNRLNEVSEHGVSVLGGMLYFYATKNDISNNYEGEGSFKLWVMKEYGVKESWTILFTIRETNLFRSGRPRYRYADGEVLLRCLYMKGGPAYVYKTLKGQFGIWPRDSIYRDEIVYTESLITPKLITTPTL